MRVQLSEFRVTWSESRLRTNVGMAWPTWADANRIVREMAGSAPGHGVHRTGFTLDWEDGRRYIGRIDLTRDHAAQLRPLSTHVRRQLECVAGRWRPPAMSDEEYNAFVVAQGLAAIDRALTLLDGYDLGDSVAPPVAGDAGGRYGARDGAPAVDDAAAGSDEITVRRQRGKQVG